MGLRFTQAKLFENPLVVEDADEFQLVANTIDFAIEGRSFPGDGENALRPAKLVIGLIQRQ